MKSRERGTPAFQVYPNDYIGDHEIYGLSDENFGRFWRVLLAEWKQIGLPGDEGTLAAWLRLRPQAFHAFWSRVRHLFVERDGRYYYPPHDLQRANQAERRKKAQDAVNTRWNRPGSVDALPGGYGRNTDVSPEQYTSSSSSSSVEPTPSPPGAADRIRLAAERQVQTLVESGSFPGLARWAGANPSDVSLLSDAMQRVVSEKGEAAVLHYIAAVNMVLDGGEHKRPSDAEFAQGLRQWIADTPEVKLRKFTNYLLGAIALPDQPAHVRANGQQPKANGLEAEAANVLAQIRKLVVVQPAVPGGRAPRKVIPKEAVERLGEAAVTAYDEVGGADRVLSTTGETMGFLIRDFTQFYIAAKQKRSHT